MSNDKKIPNYSDPLFWTTTAWNWAATDFWFQQLCTLAMSRFRWVGLPKNVDVRYLEWTLLNQNNATLAWPKGFDPKYMLALKAATNGRPNANNNYVKWTAIGDNGLKFPVYHHINGALVWDNVTRAPIMPQLQFLAAEMANIMRTIQTVRQHMRQPVIIEGPREQAQQLRNLAQMTANGEPYMITYDGFDAVKTEVLPITNGHEANDLEALQGQLRDVWNMALNSLGIAASERKLEKQTTSEINQVDEPSTLQGMGCLIARRQAANELTRLTGHEIKVAWNSDIESNNFNVMHDASAKMKAMQPQGVPRPDVRSNDDVSR